MLQHRNIIALISLLLLMGCKSKSTDLSSDKPIKPNEFIAAFPLLDNSFSANDTTIVEYADSTNINLKLLARFVPDSLTKRLMGADKKAVFRAVGRVDKNEETYLVLLCIKQQKPLTTVVVLNKKTNEFIASKDLFDKQNANGYNYSIAINKEPTFFINREKIVSDKDMRYTKSGWALMNNKFVEIVKESNERSDKLSPIIDPLDTLPTLNKLSGNYAEDERNFMSVRDGRTPQNYLFFLHIDKNNGNCVGELKGELKLTDSTHAIYNAGGDPCVIDFTFERNSITIKEKGSCGNRRGMDCFFDDTYGKKKETKKKTVKPTTTPKVNIAAALPIVPIAKSKTKPVTPSPKKH